MADVIFIAGCERSGTNYMQWVLRENFKHIIVISTEKHYEPRGVIKEIEWGVSQENRILEEPELGKKITKYAEDTAIIRERGLPPLAFVSKEFTPPKLKTQSLQVKLHVEQAMRSGSMKFLVNIKNPYGWHLSFTKHWNHLVFAKHMKHWTDLYEGWAIFEEKFPENTLFIKHEEALMKYNIVLDRIKDKFGLTRKNNPYIIPQKRLSTITNERNVNYNRRQYFANELYKEDLKNNKKAELDECREIISKKLAERFGYEIL